MTCNKCNEENKQKAELETTREEVVHLKEEVLGCERARKETLRHWNATPVATAQCTWGRRIDRIGWRQITKSFVSHQKSELHFTLVQKLKKGFARGKNTICCVFWKISFAIKWNMD